MTGKEIVIDFINAVFTLILIAFCIFYFTVGNRFANFTEFMKALVPLAFFGIAFLIKLKFSRMHYEKRKKEDNLTITLYLTFMDKIKADIITFSLPILICLIPFITTREVGLIDISQALIAFLIVFSWQRALFKKEE